MHILEAIFALLVAHRATLRIFQNVGFSYLAGALLEQSTFIAAHHRAIAFM